MQLHNRMTHLFVTTLTILAACCAFVSAVGVSPIWMAPTNLNYPATFPNTFDADVYENFTANLGEWATIEVATGARGARPLVLMDSKGTLWIMGGSPERTGQYYLTAVWNYNPKTDQYRYIWKTTNSSPFVARNAGELRVPSPSNHPGGIGYQTAIIDKNDNIWFNTYEFYGELWMFNTTSWMFVRQFGLSGVNDAQSFGANPGQPGEDVWPGYMEGQCMVTDSNNNIWMLSGNNGGSEVNRVWHFNTTSMLWTFVAGNIVNIYATHNSTFYGGTWMGGCDIDDEDRVWIYGGYGGSFTGNGDYGHLWTFDTRVKRQWEFEYGADAFEAAAQVVSSDYHPDNRPPAAEGCALIDRRDGTLMVVPGVFYSETQPYGNSDTIWLYSKSLKQWKLVNGDINAYDLQGNFSNYRAPGSVYRGSTYFGNNGGKNSGGDLYLVGGGIAATTVGAVNYKDIWFIPQDQCSNNIHKCDVNADCIEEMIGYSCTCKEGFTGDGFICVGPPVADVPMSAPTATEAPVAAPTTTSTNTPKGKTSSAELVSASLVVAVTLLSVVGL